MMRKALVGIAAAAGLSCLMTSGALAVPINSTPIRDLIEANPLAQEARVFCYNRVTGRFLHWGRCGSRVRRPVSRPRVYCRNRYTGRFLYWGACRR